MRGYCLLIGLGCLIASGIFAQSGDAERRLDTYAVADVRDLEARVVVEKADLPQLEKINKDFGILYRLKDVTIRYKDPDKLRMENRLGVFIVNGPMRYLRVPQLGLRKRDDMGAELSKRHSLLDVGVLTPSRLGQLRWSYLRHETVAGRDLPVFEIGFRDEETARYVIWVDPVRKCLVRRRWLDAQGATRATFDFLQPAEVLPGVWVPTRLEVRNAENALAGAVHYEDLKVNQNPPDTLFDTEQK